MAATKTVHDLGGGGEEREHTERLGVGHGAGAVVAASAVHDLGAGAVVAALAPSWCRPRKTADNPVDNLEFTGFYA